jgi:dihydrodipicolinate synthase/N-acetylneuraminate lyase
VYAALASAMAAGDAAAAARHQADVDSIVTLGTSIGRIKAALRARGFVPMAARMPADDPDLATSERIAEFVQTL